MKYLLVLAQFIFFCNVSTFSQEYESLKDSRDGKIYKTVKVGNQLWMAENLNVDKFRNGDKIPQVKSREEWERASENKQPAWCYLKNISDYGIKFGKLYNWYAIADSRGLAPLGWHIPTKEEWLNLTTFLGGETQAGIKLKSSSGWLGKSNGNNKSGFNGMPGGERVLYGDADFESSAGSWWSSSVDNDNEPTCLTINIQHYYFLLPQSKGAGLSVRCLKD